ncbi:Exportin-2 [Cryptotermes secundus]|uniref:Exportin-2 n=1 Tax=Cryptotermes secundus TaxID=105785 RepID=A0A2J7RI16_9NEOP|nr:exportin-2 [Cryptotermes secundus]XP_023727679.1 exportin-2 [Cryptotermes secundus]XP_033611753.1 exportin-2 [Cryptotermes secundus]PNF40478.1 Exportin-2 [Cryptotermes secundus]
MELTDDNLRTLSDYLQHTLSPDVNVRRPAEKFLESVEVNQNYPLLLLHLVDKQDVHLTIRVAGAVAFKNYIKRNWKVDDDAGDRIHIQDREAVKQLIVNLMLHSPEAIQKQLSDAVSIIGRYDFPNKWPDLISQMVEKFATGDFHVINGVLHTAHSIFKRYRFEFKSQELWTEIKFVLDKFAKPLTELFQVTMTLANVHANNTDALKVIYNSLLIICKVFYSLNFQDLPEFFEDNMKIWMENFHSLLTADVKCLQTSDDDDEPGVMEQLKSQVCDNIALYAQKYDEEFQSYLPQFVTSVWNVLVTTDLGPKYDMLVSNALQFLATVADRTHYGYLFEDVNVLTSICEKVIIPNMAFRVSDEELFVDNAEEYIRRDIEGSDVDTRRRAACDLVRVLSRYFEGKITEIFGSYVQVMLQKYEEAPVQNWRDKDTVLYLVTSLASKGQTQRHGTTQTNQLVDLTSFTTEHVLPELQKDASDTQPVLIADSIKYVMIFRTVLPREMVVGSIPQLVRHLIAYSQVVHTYAACAIEKILVMKTSDGSPVVKRDELVPVAPDLMNNLFKAMTLPGSHENEYIMKAVMRSFSSLQEHVIPFLGELLPKLTEKLSVVARNPSRPHFNHYLFEALSISIRIVCVADSNAVTSFEEVLFPIFQEILQQDIQEFVPYVFQILSLLLGQHKSGAIPEPYMVLFPCLLAPVLWERPGNIHPLVQLLQTFVQTGAAQISASQKVSGLLGVFQKLIASKVNDHEGFYLLQSLIEHFPDNTLSPYMKQVFVLLFHRLSSSRTTKFVKGLIIFFSLYAVKYGAGSLVGMIDSIQPEMFGRVLEKVIIPDVQKISGGVERKIAAVGITSLLCDSKEMMDGSYSHLWASLLQALIGLFELPEDESSLPDDHYIEVEDTPGYQAAYSQLAFANKKDPDPLHGISDPRLHLAQSLYRLSVACPGRVSPLLRTGLSDANRAYLKNYLDAAGVQLV